MVSVSSRIVSRTQMQSQHAFPNYSRVLLLITLTNFFFLYTQTTSDEFANSVDTSTSTAVDCVLHSIGTHTFKILQFVINVIKPLITFTHDNFQIMTAIYISFNIHRLLLHILLANVTFHIHIPHIPNIFRYLWRLYKYLLSRSILNAYIKFLHIRYFHLFTKSPSKRRRKRRRHPYRVRNLNRRNREHFLHTPSFLHRVYNF